MRSTVRAQRVPKRTVHNVCQKEQTHTTVNIQRMLKQTNTLPTLNDDAGLIASILHAMIADEHRHR